MADYVNPRAQACQNCVKAKAKCYGHHEGKCERYGPVNQYPRVNSDLPLGVVDWVEIV